ncbi:MAG: hypothetical protein LBC85_09540 [Fibromonadaceae bacterium]|jgi:hypothetical protein|nr:hypothetical protein [Fibromonadaceae bacterium]
MNYEAEYKKQLTKDLQEILSSLNTPEMKLKIQNWAKKFDYPFDTIVEKIKTDPVFRCVFVKDPAKQNLYQKLAANYIERLPNVKNFETLPQGSDKAKYLTNGKLFSGKLLNNASKNTKSIDFTWEVGNYLFYASHKYTKDSGGAQDNQYLDIQNFLIHARDNNYSKYIFLAICDGEYYLQKDSQTNSKTKIERLKKLTCQNSFVLTIKELGSFLKSYVFKE